jgi:ParB/RepB/Spo0J family partition protein
MELEIDALDLRYEALRVRSAEKERRLLASLSEVGQLVPIGVVTASEEGEDRRVVIDGYRRVRALRRLRRDVVVALEWQMSEIDALLLRRSLSNASGESSLEQAWLLDELRRRFRLSLEELARNFDRSPSWVSRRLALVQALPESIQALIRQGKIVPHAAAKHLVPLARANPEQCERLALQIAPHHLSSREVGEIHAAWRDASPSVRRHIVDHPELFLKTRRAMTEESDEESGRRTGLLEDVAALAAISRRACGRVVKGAASAISPAERDEIQHGLVATRARLKRLAREFSEATGGEHARSGDEVRDFHPPSEGGLDPGDRSGSQDLSGSGAGRSSLGDRGGPPSRTGGEGDSVS